MNEYVIRPATMKDIPFLIEVVVASEKGKSDKLSYATLFDIPENKAREFIQSMLEEEVDGCELSLSSFMVVEYNGELVGGSSSWIEGFDGTLPSKILKSNLIGYTFSKESIGFLQTKADMVKEVMAERENKTLQFEYFYIVEEHLGKNLDIQLQGAHEKKAMEMYPELEKAQCQLFKNSIFAIKILMRHGFKIVKTLKSSFSNVGEYLPYHEKCLLEKSYKN